MRVEALLLALVLLLLLGAPPTFCTAAALQTRAVLATRLESTTAAGRCIVWCPYPVSMHDMAWKANCCWSCCGWGDCIEVLKPKGGTPTQPLSPDLKKNVVFFDLVCGQIVAAWTLAVQVVQEQANSHRQNGFQHYLELLCHVMLCSVMICSIASQVSRPSCLCPVSRIAGCTLTLDSRISTESYKRIERATCL